MSTFVKIEKTVSRRCTLFSGNVYGKKGLDAIISLLNIDSIRSENSAAYGKRDSSQTQMDVFLGVACVINGQMRFIYSLDKDSKSVIFLTDSRREKIKKVFLILCVYEKKSIFLICDALAKVMFFPRNCLDALNSHKPSQLFFS